MKEKLIRASFLGLLDILLFSVSMHLSTIITFNNAILYQSTNFLFIAIILKIGVFFIFNIYNTLWRYASIDEIIKITLANVIGNSLVFYIFKIIDPTISLSVVIVMCFIDIFLTGGTRIAYRIARKLRNYNFASFNKNVLIIGAGDGGVGVMREYIRNPMLNCKVLGFIDDDTSKQGNYINGMKIFGGVKDVKSIVKKKNVHEIIIAMPSVSQKKIQEIISECKDANCKIKILPSIENIITNKQFTKQMRDIDIADLLGRDPVNLDNEKVCGYLHNKKVLVTGGGGSIGSELCRQIANIKPKELIILDIYENNAYDLQNELKKNHPNLNLKVLIASVRDKERIETIFHENKPDVVFHAAAHKHVPLMEDSPMEAIKNNVIGTLNVAQAADNHKVKEFVLISTDKAVNPTNIMGASKRLCEMIIQSIDKVSKTKYVAVRFGNVLGSNGSVIPLFKKQIAAGGPITITHPDIIRYFMTIPEASQLVIQAGSMANGGEIFILDMGQPVKIMDLAKDLIRLSGYEPGKDISIKIVGLRPGEKLYEELLLEEEGIENTNYAKILIGKPKSIEYKILLRNIAILKQAIADNADVKQTMMKIVHTYKPTDNATSLIDEVAATSDN